MGRIITGDVVETSDVLTPKDDREEDKKPEDTQEEEPKKDDSEG